MAGADGLGPRRLAGVTQRHLFDYLAAEVLDDMPAELRLFLLRCSVLAELTAGRGADLAVEAGGHAETLNLAAGLVRRNGTLLGFPYTHTYTIDRWNSAGKHIGSSHREPAWFRPFETPWDKSPSKPPIPMSMGGFEDGAGRIWTLFLTAGPKWSTGLGRPLRGEGGVPIYPTRDRQLLYQSRIDVIDPQRGILLVSDSIPRTFDMVIAPNLLGAIRERESGALVVEVWQVQLSAKRGSQ